MMIPKLFHLPILVTVIVIGGKSKGKETYILLPKSLQYCQHKSQLRKLTITKQISLVFNGTSSLEGLMTSNATSPSSAASILYICQVVIKPLGKSILLQYPTGIVQFWKLRYRLQLNLDCYSWLQMRLTYTDGMIDGDSRDDEVGLSRRRRINNVSSSSASKLTSTTSITNIFHTYNCHNTSPVVSNTNYRQITVSWDYSPANSDLSQLAVELDLSTYMRFSGNLTLHEKKRNCLLQNGFWCDDSDVSAEMCINPQLRCDEADSCFDGGSDEKECASLLRTQNATFNELNRYIYSSIWTNLLPWIVIGLIFTMLAVALMLVCNQRRSDLHSDVDDEDDAEDDEDNGDYNGDNIARIDGRMIDDGDNSLHKWQECINVCHRDTLCDAEDENRHEHDIDYLHHCSSCTDKDYNENSDYICHQSTSIRTTTTYKNYHHHRRSVVLVPGTSSMKSKHVETEDESLGFCIRYGGRIHRLNGDPCSPPPQHHKVYVTSESTTSSVAESYLTNDLHQPTGSSVNNQCNSHYINNNLDPSNNSTAGIGDKVTPTESCSSNLNDEGVKSQVSVLTYCDISTEPIHNDEVCLQRIGQSIATPPPPASLSPLSTQEKLDTSTCYNDQVYNSACY